MGAKKNTEPLPAATEEHPLYKMLDFLNLREKPGKRALTAAIRAGNLSCPIEIMGSTTEKVVADADARFVLGAAAKLARFIISKWHDHRTAVDVSREYSEILSRFPPGNYDTPKEVAAAVFDLVVGQVMTDFGLRLRDYRVGGVPVYPSGGGGLSGHWPAAALRVGCCETCGTVFGKRRKDQIYCGKACGDLAAKRAERKRKSGV